MNEVEMNEFQLSIIDLICELEHCLKRETGSDKPILSIKVSPQVWHKVAAEIVSSPMSLQGRRDYSMTPNNLEIHGIEITK